MKTVTPGHKYILENHEAKDQPGQILQFIEKTPVAEGSPDLRTVNDGTTNEEVLRVLIDRLNQTTMDLNIPITTASVKVMRSFDYCHFEVTLGTVSDPDQRGLAWEAIDELRKEAARLADKAVAQYKVAKEHAEGQEAFDLEGTEAECAEIEAKPESERTPGEQARLKARKDELFRANRDYDYEDDWE